MFLNYSFVIYFIIFNRTKNSTVTETKWGFHKCCGIGQVYNLNSTGDVPLWQCFNHSTSKNRNPHKLFWTVHQDPFAETDEKVEFVIGFPSSCNVTNTLDPDNNMTDRFYLTGSGQMVLPHQFHFLQSQDYCIEEFTVDGDISTVS